MDIRLFIGFVIPATRGFRDANREQARELAQMGLLPAAFMLETIGEMCFAPVIAMQDQIASAIRDSAVPSR